MEKSGEKKKYPVLTIEGLVIELPEMLERVSQNANKLTELKKAEYPDEGAIVGLTQILTVATTNLERYKKILTEDKSDYAETLAQIEMVLIKVRGSFGAQRDLYKKYD